jgi:hypothetical protein
MKKLNFLFLVLIAFLLFVAEGFAQTYIFKNNLKLVAQGTATAANTQLSLVDGTAFAYLVGVDLSAYQTGKHLFIATNASTGLLIGQGYCSATSPAGETLGDELVTLGDFSDTTGWTLNDGYSIGTGVLTAISGTGKYAYRAYVSLPPIGGLLKATIDVNTVSGNGVNIISSNAPIYIGAVIATTGTKTVYGVKTDSVDVVGVRRSVVTDPFIVDNLSVKQVLDPPSTGVRIVSAKSGATQNWTSKGSGAVNANISYKIYYVGE